MWIINNVSSQFRRLMRKLNMFIPTLCLAGFSHWIKCVTDKRNSNLTIQKPLQARDLKIISTATGIFKRYTLANTNYWLNTGETDEFYMKIMWISQAFSHSLLHIQEVTLTLIIFDPVKLMNGKMLSEKVFLFSLKTFFLLN